VLEIDTYGESANVSRITGSPRFVTFFFGESLYGIAADDVAEVTHPLPVSPLPNGPEYLAGISPLRGDIIAVVALSQMLGETPARHQSASKFIILKSGENDSRPAFRVDRVHELATLDVNEINDSPSPASIVCGTAKVGPRVLNLIQASAVRSALG
jgi:chemotaxis signal transduction protein